MEKPNYKLLIILLVALLLRLHFGIICDAKPDFSDMAIYNHAALASGVPTFPPPGYPLFLRFIYALFGTHNYNAVYIIQGLLSTFTVYLIYLVTRRTSTETAGLIAAGIAAVYPNFIAYNLTTMTESLSVLLILVLLASLTMQTTERNRSIFAAVTLCIGYFIRPSFIFFFPSVFLVVKKRTILILTMAVLLSPWLIYGKISGGGSGRAAMLFYKSYNELADGISGYDLEKTKLGSKDLSSTTYIKGTLEFVATNKWQTVNIIYNKAALVLCRGWDTWVLENIVGKNEFLVYFMYHHYVPIIFLGIFGMIKRYNKRNRMVALMVLGYLLFHILFSIFKFRYRLLVEPMFIMFTGMLIAGWVESFDITKVKKFWTRTKKRQTENIENGWDLREFMHRVRNGVKSNWKILLVLFVVALGVRVYVAFTYDTPPTQRDVAMMIRLAHDGGFDQFTPPLYPAFLRGIFILFGKSNFTAVYLVQGILNALMALMMFGIVTHVCNKTAGIIAAALCAVYPNFLIYNIVILDQSLSLFFVCLLLAIVVTDLKDLYKSVTSAIIIGLAILVKPVFLLFVPGLLVVLKKRKVFLLVMLIVLLPWGIRNMTVHQKFMPVFHPSSYQVNLQNYIGHKHKLAIVDKLYHNGAVIFSRGWSKMQKVQLKSYIYAARYGYMVVMMLGLIGLTKYYQKEQRYAFLPVLGYFLLIIFFSQFKFNLRTLIEPLLIMYSAVLISGKCRRGDVPNTMG